MRLSALVSVVASFCVFAGCAKAAVDVGKVDKTEAQPAKTPKSDDGVAKVALRATIIGETAKGEKRTAYILVCPISNKDTSDWWVQEAVSVTGEKFTGSCQFGEGSAGAGEYFAVFVMATDKKYSVGERLSGVPTGQTYSKTVVVKRSD